ncbi:hypothetical protein DFJ67_1156 [Asanoa ferruginea]|uniref:Uncharacterized protein n=1 Tax=Asanoa ferruginea TaxID=53367 RepID=A0A3D9ZFB2_9ACTN|nr:hypothetical protein [Asanoa ferruginea]REF95204.1 hypothetical protein DFJ67_1156 [Asanoa ferruginea]GIF52810.1 hypothetical protein Afe04nite_73490 [Asanoa ferruginea]
MNNIRQLLEEARTDAPPSAVTVDDIVRAGRKRLRRSRSGKLAGAALGIGAAVTALTIATSSLAGSPPAPPAAPPIVAPTGFTVTFAGYQVGDFRVADPAQITPGYQRSVIKRANVDLGGGSRTTLDAGTLTVYAPGVFRPDRYDDGTAIVVGGRPGYATTLDRRFIVGEPGSNRRSTRTEVLPLPAVAWQYATGSWATLESEDVGARGVPADALRQLAEAFAPAASPRPATTAFRARYVPAGWTLASAGSALVTGDDDLSTAHWVRGGARFDSLAEPVDLEGSLVVRVAPVQTEGPHAHPVTPPCPAGQHICDVRINDHYYAQVHDSSGTLPTAELRAIADGLEFATIDRPESWFPVQP